MPTVGLPTVELTPRMVMLSCPGPAGPLLCAAKETPGTIRETSSRSSMCSAAMAWPSTTPTLTATSLVFSSRLFAVTTTSDRVAELSPASTAESASAAATGPATASAASRPPVTRNERIRLAPQSRLVGWHRLARRDACHTIKQLLCQFREGGARAPVRVVFVALAQPQREAAERA